MHQGLVIKIILMFILLSNDPTCACELQIVFTEAAQFIYHTLYTSIIQTNLVVGAGICCHCQMVSSHSI